MKGGADALPLAVAVVAALLLKTSDAYFFPAGSEYLSARSKELAATRGRKAKRESVACKAHDILPELNTDVRLAGWRVKRGDGAAAAEGGEGAAAVGAGEAAAEEPVLVDTHKQGHMPVVGDVVEYALPPHLLLDDGRIKGVGVLLSVNRDRLDAGSLPDSKLDLCQIDPLTIDTEAEWHGEGQGREEGGQAVWKKDELEPRHFCAYKDLKKVRSRENGMADRWRRWVLEEPLSDGAGPPVGAEEELTIL